MIEQLTKAATVGSEWVLWVLMALSVISISLIGERTLYFLRRRIDVTDFGDRIIKGLESGDHTELLKMLAAHPSVEAQVVRRSLEWFEHGPEAVAEVVEAAVRERRKELEQGSVFLGTVGNNAPFVGLLGTVLGVVQAFQELEKSSGGAMGSVMGGIAEALVATAAGIVVALPAVVAFNYFSKKTAEIEDNARSLMSLVFAYQKRKPLVAGGAE
jgi:biopolymer transport protein ExbB/biopolymer transport protein TolQ